MKFFSQYTLLLILLTGYPHLLSAQYTSDADLLKRVKQCPQEVTHSVEDLSDYLTKDLLNQRDKAFAIYAWLALNIEYDSFGVENVTQAANNDLIVEEALESRKGVCQHYAALFDTLATIAGLKTIMIYGYTKQYGKIASLPHAWNAVEIDSSWYTVDPTWGSGYFDGKRYVEYFSFDYFMIEPEKSISSHMPFDPLFQFLEYPVGHEEFKYGKPSSQSVRIDFKPEIEQYLASTEEQRLPEAMERVKEFGIANSMIRAYYSNLNMQNNVFYANRQIDMHNQAIELFNEVINDFNLYADEMNSRGGRFPDQTMEIENQLLSLRKNANEVNTLFDSINPPMSLEQTLDQNRSNLIQLIDQLNLELDRLQKEKSKSR